MTGKLPIDRVREQEHANQPKKDSAKKRVAEDQADVERRARVYDDDASTRALESGETPTVDDRTAKESS